MPTRDKRFWDYYKLARDLKDTWAHCIEALIVAGRVPPENMRIFRIQSYRQPVEIYCPGFTGCFRLQQLVSFTVSNCGASFAEDFKRLVVTCHGFAKMVFDDIQRWHQAPFWEDERECQVAEKVLGYLPNAFPNPPKSLENKRRDDDDE